MVIYKAVICRNARWNEPKPEVCSWFLEVMWIDSEDMNMNIINEFYETLSVIKILL